MKRIFGYGFHLIVATLVVPFLAIMVGGFLGQAFGSASRPQQFYSDHVIFLIVVAGALLAYAMGDTFTDGLAAWVWIPFTMVFLLRVLDWRAAGSVLIGPGSFVGHFFTADCQIQNWREGGFGSRCSDKLFLTPLFVGSLSYSTEAAILRLVRHRRSLKSPPQTAIEATSSPLQLVTTRLRALMALALTGSVFAIGFRRLVTARPASWTWLGSGLLPTWAVVTINIAFWAVICRIGVALAFAPLRKDEKALLVSLVGGSALVPVGALLPRITGGIHVVQTMLSLTAFLAALAILLSLSSREASATPDQHA